MPGRGCAMNIFKEHTVSLCPICYKRISAQVYEKDGYVYMKKQCTVHGEYIVLIEKDAEVYKQLLNVAGTGEAVKDKLMIAVTHACNIGCSICYMPNRSTPDVSLDEFKKAVTEFSGRLIRLSGGEPTLREDLCGMIQFASARGHEVSLVTNGLKLVDRVYVRKLKEAGLTYVSLSISGFDDDIYKNITGASILKVKKKAIQNVIAEKIKLVLSCTIVKNVNEGEIEKIFRYYVKNKKYIHSLRIRCAVSVGHFECSGEQLFLSDLISVFARIFGVSNKQLVELCIKDGRHSPCQLDIDIFSVLLAIKSSKQPKFPLLVLFRTMVLFLKIAGLRNSCLYVLNLMFHKEPFEFSVCLRIWYDKHRIDYDEISRCSSTHLISGTNTVVPLCVGYTLNTNTLML